MNARNDAEGKSGKRGGPAWLGKRKAAERTRSDPDWKKHQVKDSGENFKYRLKRTLLWIGCLALLVAFVIYLNPPKNTPLVIFRASRYPLQMPPLALAAEDEVFLRRVSPENLPVKNSSPFHYIGSKDNLTDEEGTPQRFLAQLGSIRPSGPGWFSRNNLVIVYISAHGLVNGEGQACLVPPNADAFDTSRWLPLGKLLKDISQLKNLKRSRKLVILDCNRISTKWRSGVMDNRFADQLPSVVDSLDDPNFYLLNSTSPGQIAWAAPELTGSVFGHFVALGLRGDASAEQNYDNRSGVVSLLELHAYLASRVDNYVQERRGVRQTPMLIGGVDGLEVTRDRDIPIVSADRWQAWRSMAEQKSAYDVLGEAKELIEPADQKPSPLQLAWQAYQQRATANVDDRSSQLPLAWRRGFVMDPVRWASLEQRLLALEERLFAGEEYQEGLAGQFAAIYDELSAGNWQEFAKSQSASNLRLARWQRLADVAAEQAGSEQPPTDHSLLYDSWLKAEPAEKSRITFPDAERPAATGQLLARYGLTDAAQPDQSWEKFPYDRLNSVLQFLRLAKNTPPAAEAVPVEAHFLKLLALSPSSLGERLMPEAIRSRSLAEQAATPLDVRTHYALELLVNQADKERRDAEDAYFLGDQKSLDGAGADANQSAERRWLRAQGFAPKTDWHNSGTGYLAARKWGEELENMFLLRDEIWATLPHLAEWYFRRWRLELSNAAASKTLETEFQTHIKTLTEVLDENVSFAEQLERLLLKRDNEEELRAELRDAYDSFQALNSKWEGLRSLVDTDSESRGSAEIRFQTAESVRRIEQVMQTPLFREARVKGLLSKYHNTLDYWSKNELSKRPQQAPAQTATETKSQALAESFVIDGYRTFLIRYHKVLTHEFKLPYEQHRETLELNKEDALVIDQQLRQQKTKDRTIWQSLQNLLSDYDGALEGKPVDVGPTSRAVQARRELSIWDRRVRAGAFWLGCFNQGLVADPTSIPTPTAWLREVDHWHLSCWHGYRVLQDFWGNGLTQDRGEQYFNQAAKYCAKAAQAGQLPFQYDLPGSSVEPLDELRKTRQTAHEAGLEVHVPSKQISDPPLKTAVEFAASTTQRVESTDHMLVNFPAGDAGFFISRAGSPDQIDGEILYYGPNKVKQRYPVKLIERLRDPPGPRAIECFAFANLLEKPPVSLQGNVWYRGHIWSSPFEFYYKSPAQGVQLVHRREPYSAPTVQVIGDDAPSGAVMFVLDCSYSMRPLGAGDGGRFPDAKGALEAILTDLSKADVGGLQIGLMAYAHRTPHRSNLAAAPNDQMYYKTDKLWDDSDNLTAAGIAAKMQYGPKFPDLFPHPDRDIQLLFRPSDKWAGNVERSLTELTVDHCFGVTPLYAAIVQAIKQVKLVKNVESRQVIVISDGVNFPNAGTVGGTFVEAGRKQNARDLEELTETLKNNKDTRVRVVLFGGVKPGLEAKQLISLTAAGSEPEYVIDEIPSPKAIKRAIEAAFIKPTFEVVAADPDRTNVGKLALGDIWTYPQWPTSGDLLPPQAHQAIVRAPRLLNPLLQDIQLSGGEALLLRYDAPSSKLVFMPADFDWFSKQELKAVGNIQPPDHPLLVEAGKPTVLQPEGETRSTTFRLHLRSLSNIQFVARPRYVWAEIRPQTTDARYKDLVYQISDLKFEDKTRTPIMQFQVPRWPLAVEGAKIDLWIRYGNPPPLFPAVTIGAADTTLPTIVGGKFGLEGVDFTIRQQLVEGTRREIEITERHPDGTPLSKLYRTRVQLTPPADRIERMYIPPAGNDPTSKVTHTFYYSTPVHLAANVSLEVNTAEQIKESSLRLENPLEITRWNQ